MSTVNLHYDNSRHIKSYVLRMGRITPSQKKGWEQHWERYGLSSSTGVVDFNETFSRTSKTILEIGFGMGGSLLDMAIKYPEYDFVGVEVYRPGVGSLLIKIANMQLRNIRVYCEDAVNVINTCIQSGSLSRMHIFFPDPWPKKRHHKRRLMQPEFIDNITTKMSQNGVMHFATDWVDYARHVEKIMSKRKDWKSVVKEEGLFNVLNLRGVDMETKFERRGKALGLNPHDLLFQRLNRQ